MRSGSLAEAMLALFTSPDRASSTIGDLAEQAQSHGRVWFWLQVLRTTAALFWRDLFEAPLRISALLVVGIIPHSLMAGSVAFPLAQLAGLTPMFGLDWPAWQIGILVCGQVLLPLIFGLLLARFSNGRPMTVCIASAVVGQGLLSALYCHSAWALMEELTLTDKLFYLFNLDLKTHAFVSTIIAIPMIAAGYLYRRRALRRQMAH